MMQNVMVAKIVHTVHSFFLNVMSIEPFLQFTVIFLNHVKKFLLASFDFLIEIQFFRLLLSCQL